MAHLCADPTVGLVFVAVPDRLNLEAVRLVVEAGKRVLCTKPLGRTGAEAAEMLRLVLGGRRVQRVPRERVLAPDVMKVREIVAFGSLGRVLTMRAREAHSGPHGPHFRNREAAGRGALLDVGCHAVESVRYIVGKDQPVRDAFAWGATLAHGDGTSAEERRSHPSLRGREDREDRGLVDLQGGLELRQDVRCERRRIVRD